MELVKSSGGVDSDSDGSDSDSSSSDPTSTVTASETESYLAQHFDISFLSHGIHSLNEFSKHLVNPVPDSPGSAMPTVTNGDVSHTLFVIRHFILLELIMRPLG